MRDAGLVYRFSLFCLRSFFLPYWPTTCIGLENVPLDGPLLLVGNHPTVLDGLVLGSVLPRTVAFMVSEEPLRVPIVGPWLRALGFIPVRKGGRSLEAALQALAQGRCVGVYPEGVPTHSYRLQDWRSGIAVLARESGARVVPVGIVGSLPLCQEDALFVSGGPIRLSFGRPLHFGSQDEVAGIVQRLRAALQEQIQPDVGLPKFSPDWRFRLCAAVWKPVSWSLLRLADWARPGGRR